MNFTTETTPDNLTTTTVTTTTTTTVTTTTTAGLDLLPNNVTVQSTLTTNWNSSENPSQPDLDLNANSSTSQSTTTSTATAPVYVIPPDYSCPRINDTYAEVNSTDVREGTAISVTCRSPAKLVTLPQNQNVFYCNEGHWRPLTPSCRLADTNSNETTTSSSSPPPPPPSSGSMSSSSETVTLTTETTSSSATTATTSDDVVLNANISTSQSTTTSTTQASTTVPVYEIPPDYSCPRINDTYAEVNSTDVKEGTVISVTCRPPAKLVTLPKNQNVFYCNGAHWRPLAPSCRLGADSPTPVGVIVGCSIGGFICLVLVVVALFLLCRSMKDRKIQNERSKEFNDKMDQICMYVNTPFQDSVGMPVMTMDTRDSGLRGRVSQTNNEQSPVLAPDPNEAGKLGADLF